MSAPVIRHRADPRVPVIEPALTPASVAMMEPSPADAGDGYEVGYRKPPLATRFGGPRGNRSGRKPQSKSLEVAIAKELATKVEVTLDGRRQRLSKQDVLAKTMVNAAIAGKAQPQRLVFGHLMQQVARAVQAAQAVADAQPAVASEIGDDEAEALRFLASLLDQGEPSADQKEGDV